MAARRDRAFPADLTHRGLLPPGLAKPFRSWPAYPAYKPSGVESLGDIPSHWDVWKMGHAFRRIGSGTTPPTDDSDFYDGDIPWVTTSELRENVINDTNAKLTPRALKELSALSLYPPGTLVVAMYGATIGRLGILSISACTNQACCAFAEPFALEPKFAFYWLWARRSEIIGMSSGGGQPNINQDKLKTLRVPAPSIPEQRAIAAFLDCETARLDALIAKHERLIELLQEKRTALISHAVTKGLDPSAPMKDSGVPWLGEIPTHWTMRRLKNVKSSGKNAFVDGPFGSNLKTEHFVSNGEVLVIESGFATRGMFQNEFKRITKEHFETIKRSETQAGDIIIAKIGAYFGLSSILPDVGALAVVSGNSMKLTVDITSNATRFIHYHLLQLKWSGAIDLLAGTTAQPALSLQGMNTLALAIPPLAEQNTIVDWLDLETSNLDALITRVHEAIEKLREYRSALISAAVTGKIDVRDYQNLQGLDAEDQVQSAAQLHTGE